MNNSVDENEIARLRELSAADRNYTPDVQIRHTYPPKWSWPSSDNTKLVYIQPWEYMATPFEWQTKFENFADLLIVPSRWTACAFTIAGLHKRRVRVIPNGYNPDIFYPPASKKEETLKVLYVGCYQFRKGVDVLLQAWSQNTRKEMPIKLTIKDSPQIYGHSDLAQKVMELQDKNACADMEYDDSDKSDKEMADLYRQCHVLVHPYRGEGFGMHIQEAMACGCIPLVTAGGPTDEFVEEFRIASSRHIVNMHEIFGLKSEDSTSLMGHYKYVLEPDPNALARQLHHILDNYKTIKVNKSKLTTWQEAARRYADAVEYVINEFPQVKRRV
ncbi:MAG: glycosyltransferase family 4 protein [Deltaproteobacteria bacterium]|nr:glycosyltransferase family 4 protein [Deltaproteobacteria bacterium]